MGASAAPTNASAKAARIGEQFRPLHSGDGAHGEEDGAHRGWAGTPQARCAWACMAWLRKHRRLHRLTMDRTGRLFSPALAIVGRSRASDGIFGLVRPPMWGPAKVWQSITSFLVVCASISS